jgi:hypothetical protein
LKVGNLPVELVDKAMGLFCHQERKAIHPKFVRRYMASQPNLINISFGSSPEDETINIVGDIHGRFYRVEDF